MSIHQNSHSSEHTAELTTYPADVGLLNVQVAFQPTGHDERVGVRVRGPGLRPSPGNREHDFGHGQAAEAAASDGHRIAAAPDPGGESENGLLHCRHQVFKREADAASAVRPVRRHRGRPVRVT